MAARDRKSPTDSTGRNAVRLAEENADAQKQAAQHMSTITAQTEREAQATQVLGADGTVVGALDDVDSDLAAQPDDNSASDAAYAEWLALQNATPAVQQPQAPAQNYVDPNSVLKELPDEAPVSQGSTKVRPATMKFRVNTDLENVTIGTGTNFDFAEGRRYEAPTWVYDHLEEKGYIYH